MKETQSKKTKKERKETKVRKSRDIASLPIYYGTTGRCPSLVASAAIQGRCSAEM